MNASRIPDSLEVDTRATLAGLILRRCPADGKFVTAIPGLTLFRGSDVSAPACAIVSPVIAIIAQGAKRIVLGGETHDYDARHYLVSSVELPMYGQITAASAQAPYLGLAIDLQPLKIAELDARIAAGHRETSVARGLGVGLMTAAMHDAVLRLLRLLDTPQDIAVLAPLIEQELLYHVLRGPLGARLRHASTNGHRSHQVVRAINRIKSELARPLSIDELARTANMSRSSLHHHFKALTAMTPLQYQKLLRLQEARNLMLLHDEDAATAAHRVGYESASQFSREYRRLFGQSPARDIAQLRLAEEG